MKMRQAALKIVRDRFGAAPSSSQLETPGYKDMFQDLLPDSSARRHLAGLTASGLLVTSFIAFLLFSISAEAIVSRAN
jgi:hypothetical protein